MSTKITKISITNDKISGRGGLPLMIRYIERTRLFSLMLSILTPGLKIHSKGLQPEHFLKQIFAFFIDGTDITMSGFDVKKKDQAYAALLEAKSSQLASSHQIKRFFAKIALVPGKLFRKILHELFIWRLRIEKPSVIHLGIDTMVMDNDSSKKREGCEPTYKRKKGFQPLHISWGPYLVDVIFRKGSAHSNHGSDFIDSVTGVVNLIRSKYSPDVPIILLADSGFADQKAFAHFEDYLNIHYIITNKLYEDIREYARDLSPVGFSLVRKDKTSWMITEFGNRLKSWSRFRRSIYTKLQAEQDGQYILESSQPESIITTNIGMCKMADDRMRRTCGEKYFEAEEIVKLSHSRGADELIHRSLKELATREQLPFRAFGMNQAYYYLLVIVHFMFETYKRDVTPDVIPVTVYPDTFRRRLIDFAVKITSKARYIVMSVTRTIYETINIDQLWKRCQSPPVIQFA